MTVGNVRFTRRALCSAGLSSLLLRVAGVSANADASLVRYFSNSFSPVLRRYLREVIVTVLENSQAHYGPYRLTNYERQLSTSRMVAEVGRGQSVDITFGSSWNGNSFQSNGLISLNYPVFFGFLGLRSLLVRKDREALLKSATQAEQVRSLSAGQGANWPDTQILRLNGLTTIEAQRFDSLFPMLAKGRFDLLPLSVLEAEVALAAVAQTHPELVINDDIKYFYPMPFNLFVTPHRQRLAERLQHGLEVAMADGTMQQLFDRHFHAANQLIIDKRYKLLMLENPLMAEADTQVIKREFLKGYGDRFDILS